MMKKYAIVDIETTGGQSLRDKIIEIAIIVTDGKKILDEFESLVHPERSIPKSITRITGIDDDMVSDAPRFYEIARSIIEILEGCIFVAHNVNFDYSFIKQEFASLGYPFNKKRLCTVKLTRSQVPGLKSYGLDGLIKQFNLTIENRHRAYGDAFATYELFNILIQDHTDDYHLKQLINYGIDASVLPQGISIEEMHSAPESPGVYYLINTHGHIVYIGKAKNIRKRLFQHFRKLTRKSLHIHNRVHKLNYEETGHELIALLLELHEIKSLKPELNKSLRRTNFPYALYQNDHAGLNQATFVVAKNNNKNDLRYRKLKLFGSKMSADGFIQHVLLEGSYCKKEFKTRSRNFECSCMEECTQFFTDRHAVNNTFVQSIQTEFDQDFVLLLDGRNSDEQSFVMVENGKFKGFGYLPLTDTLRNREEWFGYLHHQFFYPEANGIIKNFMNKNHCEVIPLMS